MKRGKLIELQASKTDYKDWTHIDTQMVGNFKPGMFPLVDFMKGQTAVSLKSVDTTGATWATRMTTHIKDLNSRRAIINGQPAEMMLDIRVQTGGIEAGGQRLDQLKKLAKENNIELNIVEHP